LSQSGFWWVLVACAIYGVIHSALASSTVKDFAERKLGSRAKRIYRFVYVIFACAALIPLAVVVLAAPDARLYIIPAPWIYLALALQVGALACLVYSLLQDKPMQFLGLAPILFPPEKGAHKLNTTGFNAWVRHPLYFFSFVLMWLFPIMTWNLLALFGGLTVYTIIGSLLEERRLLKEFGTQYKEYQKRTPWLIPIKFN